MGYVPRSLDSHNQRESLHTGCTDGVIGPKVVVEFFSVLEILKIEFSLCTARSRGWSSTGGVNSK
jgi:hypothetical protein